MITLSGKCNTRVLVIWKESLILELMKTMEFPAHFYWLHLMYTCVVKYNFNEIHRIMAGMP